MKNEKISKIEEQEDLSLFKDYKPEMSIKTDDGSYRRVLTEKLGVSGRKFTMVQPRMDLLQKEDMNLFDMLAEILLTMERCKEDPNYKTSPIINFEQLTPTLRINEISKLGEEEAAPLVFAYSYLRYLAGQVFRTGRINKA